MSGFRKRLSDLAWRYTSGQPGWPELPPPTEVSFDDSLLSYWRRRLEQHMCDSYAGVPMMKFPEDLRVYEHLLWLSRANVVIEVGSYYGGSALWFRDRLRVFHDYGRVAVPHVISIDLDVTPARRAIQAVDRDFASTISLLSGDIGDPATTEQIDALVPTGARCFVVEDSAHTYEATIAALTQLAHFVSASGFFIVEDGCVDVAELRVDPGWPSGVLHAMSDWLASESGSDFDVRRDLELYGVTCHPRGFLQRKPETR